MQAAVLNAVSDTESSVFPLERLVMKFDMLPPGQEATKIMPNATMGVMTLLKANAIKSVTKGSATHCIMQPTMIDLGKRNTSLNVSNLMPSATPNMTRAKIMFTRVISPAPKLGSSGSKISKYFFIRKIVQFSLSGLSLVYSSPKMPLQLGFDKRRNLLIESMRLDLNRTNIPKIFQLVDIFELFYHFLCSI